MGDTQKPPSPTSPTQKLGENQLLTSLLLLPWSSRTNCGHHNEDPTEIRHPCTGFLQKASGPEFLWGNSHQ